MTKRVRRILAVALLGVSCAHGQRLTGRLEGVIMDALGAVIVGAEVTVTHQETGAVYSAATSDVGRFAIPHVRLGRYTVKAAAGGFQSVSIPDVLVEVGGTTSLTITLELGAAEFEVTVEATAALDLVNLTDSELGGVVDNRQVLDLPLNGRNAVELAFQQAGVYFERGPDGQGNKLLVHGQRHRAINMTLDGIDTQDNFNRSSTTMIDQPLLPMAAENVQEFRVVTGMASSEYGHGAAQISAVTRSGSNQTHGSLFWFYRNDAFSANDFFNNSAGVDVPQLNRNQFGGRVGGPLVRNKTFFYLGYQQTRLLKGLPVNRTVYTAPAREGRFRYLDGLENTPQNVAANPGRVRTVNLLECGPGVTAALGRDCLDGRFNGTDRPSLDPFIGSEIFGVMPPPNNFDRGDGLNTGGFRFNAKSLTVEHLPSIRLDHRFNDRHSFHATFNYVDRDIQGDFLNGRERVYPALDSLGDRITHTRAYGAGLISTFSPTVVNEFRFGFLGGENAFLIEQPFDTPFTLDLNTITDPYEPNDNDDVRDNRTVHLRNTINWTRGRHQWKFGVEWRQRFIDRYDFDNVNAFGNIGFDDNDNSPGFSTRDLTALSGGESITSSNAELARDLINNLVGAVGEVFLNFNVESLNSGFIPFFPERRAYKNHELDWFVNDTWTVRPNLTVNLGLRWEYATVPYETRGLALAPEGNLRAVYGVSGPRGFFNPGVFDGAPCEALDNLPAEVTTANARALIGSCATAYLPASSSNGRPLWKDDFNNFGPLVSLAWDPFGDGKTSVRAGFRISHVQDSFSIIGSNLDDNEGLQVTESCVTSEGGCLNNPTLLRDVIGGGPPVPATPEFRLPSARSILDTSFPDFRTFDEGLGTPYYNEWTFSVSREVIDEWALELRYVGNRGVALRRVADYNEFNVDVRDAVTGETFLQSFVKAQQNLNCNRQSGFAGRGFDDITGASCIAPNPLMADLIAGEPGRLRNRASLVTALERNETGQFLNLLTQGEFSRPASDQGRIRGGSFWGQVLDGRFPANFFLVNPFVVSARAMINDGSSTYHALQAELRRRFGQGLSVQANYTYGKALADFDGDENTLLNQVRPSSVINPRYSRQEIMPRHQFNTNWICELPVGAGKRYLNRGNLATVLLGNWQLGGLLAWRSGRPLSVRSSAGTFHTSFVSVENTVDLSGDVSGREIRDLTGKRDIGAGVFWIDPCTSAFLGGGCTESAASEGLFRLPAPGRLGQLGRSIVFGPGRFILDWGLSKRARLRESLEMEFRWEVFNALNNANFDTPELNVTSSSFGRITQTVTEPRVMQFALKLNF